MCFVNDDYDWVAEEIVRKDGVAKAPIRCDECHRMIQIGEFVHHVYMCESASGCVRCDNGDCECEGECCKCPQPDHGETFDYDRCQDCHRFLEAVQVSEEEAGCSGNETQPYLGEAFTIISEQGAEEAKRYAKKCLQMYPGMRAWIAQHWREMFAH